MSRILVLLLFLLGSFGSFAQFDWRDSVRKALTYEPDQIIALNNRSSFVNANTVAVYGVVFGLDYNDRLFLFSGLNYQFNRNKRMLIGDPRFPTDTVEQLSRVAYMSFGGELTIHKGKRFRARVPLQIGIGGMRQTYGYNGLKIDSKTSLIIPLEFGVNTSFKIFELLYLGGGLGYRVMIGNESALRLSAPYYSLGLSVPLVRAYNKFSNWLVDQ